MADALLLLVLSVVVFATWLPHLIFSVTRYRREHTFRTFRGLFVAIMLQLALLRGLAAAFVRAYPGAEAVNVIGTAAGVIALVLLLSGGVALTLTWLLERGWRPPWRRA